METQVKINVMETQIKNKVKEYLEKSSLHLFLKKYHYQEEFGKTFYKVIPAEINGELHYISIEGSLETGEVKIDRIRNVSWVQTKKALGEMKDYVFPKYYKHKSIRKIKKLQEKFAEIKDYISSNPDKDKDEIKAKLDEILNKK